MSSESDTKRKEKVKEILEKYRLAGKISIEAKKLAAKIIKPGANLYEVAQRVEGFILEQGASLAFPINISINNEAAHYSPEIDDQKKIPQNSIVKVDLGAHIDGYIVDTAITLNFNPELEELTKSAQDALDAVIKIAKPGVKLAEIGKLVEKTITQAGFQPIKNLSGHQIKRYVLHAGISVPNCGPSIMQKTPGKLQPGKIYAVEPFASTGKGWVKNGPRTNIFRFVKAPSKKQKDIIPIAVKYKKKVGVLPFSPRNVHDGKESREDVTLNLNKLMRANVIMGYPVLVEETKQAMVSQFEHTLRITKDGCEVLTSYEY